MAQSCFNCGAEAMPGEWVPISQLRGAVERVAELEADLKRERAARRDADRAFRGALRLGEQCADG